MLSDSAMKAAIKAGLKSPPAVSSRLRCVMLEAAAPGSSGSIGAYYVAHHARQAGFSVDLVAPKDYRGGYDVEMISVHHCTDWPRLAAMPKRAPIRIIGGHVMANNPRPGIPMADAVCIGEGETWIQDALAILDVDFRAETLSALSGTIVSSEWDPGMTPPEPNVERPLPSNPPYLNRPDTLEARWYIEIARGCPYRCAYCELGHSVPYRAYPFDHIEAKVAEIDSSVCRKLNWFAPDEASHPDYPRLMDLMRDNKYQQAFGSYRVDQVLKRGIIPYSASQLIRVGIDGLTEATRFRVGKKISDDMIIEYFRTLTRAGHVQFKMFMMIGYPWETPADFDQWAALMERVRGIQLDRSVWCRIKWTPLIPQPCTPLRDVKARYDIQVVNRIHDWHKRHRQIARHPGWHFENDGLMGFPSHKRQIALTWAAEQFFLGRAKYVNPAWKRDDGDIT